ncbi:Carboxylesterase NlhH [Colletotrichum siamense]|nr:Carboxylesterase NlhH [Colletotrichum siamense]
MIMGNRFVGATLVLEWAVRFDAVCILVEYRLAPEHPAPAALHDCYAGLKWVDKNARSLGIDPKSIVIVGQSGGGGLAAGTVLLARDQSGPAVKGQLLICPMLDNNNDLVSSTQCNRQPWTRAYNEMAWKYVFDGQAEEDRDPYSAPAHNMNLENLPPTYIDVGSAEIFRDECVAYASRLLQSGNMTELHVWPGAFHCFDAYVPAALVSQSARRSQVEWITRVLHSY